MHKYTICIGFDANPVTMEADRHEIVEQAHKNWRGAHQFTDRTLNLYRGHEQVAQFFNFSHWYRTQYADAYTK